MILGLISNNSIVGNLLKSVENLVKKTLATMCRKMAFSTSKMAKMLSPARVK
jgi:hypothetical protein